MAKSMVQKALKVKDSSEQRAWYFYDWANSAYVTTTQTVLFGPYLTVIAKNAAGCEGEGECVNTLAVGPLAIAPGSLFLYVVTFTTLLAAFLLPLLGAYADLRHDKHRLLGKFAWVGALAAAAMFFVQGTNWQLGVVLLVIGNLSLGGSLVLYDALLIDLASPDERDRISSRGWALGYVGGGLLLIANLALVLMHSDTGFATRISLLSAGIWWGAWTLIPYLKIKNKGEAPAGTTRFSTLAAGSFTQLGKTLRDLRRYPQTLKFLVAYLFFNDGVQTVIAAASIYGAEELGLPTESLIIAIVIVQIVAVFGALGTGKLASQIGGHKTVLSTLFIWTFVVLAGYFVPAKSAIPFFALAACIGFVLGGTQALSRSIFSQLVPKESEAEYFGLYQAFERGTSWLGTLAFGLIAQFMHSYRPAIIALIFFFIVGGILLKSVDFRKGIQEAGNEQPVLV